MNAAWIPTDSYVKSTRLYKWMKKLGFTNYNMFYRKSIEDVAWFWEEVEKELEIDWYRPYTNVLDESKGIEWPKWYVDAQLNATHLSLEKWKNDLVMKNEVALVWEGEDGTEVSYTFSELSEKVNNVAGGLHKLGIRRGDVVAIYMPMIPEVVIAMMAITKIGAVFSPLFSGYGADAITVRLQAAETKAVITADGFLRRGKKVKMKDELDRALHECPTVSHVVVVPRLSLPTIDWDENRDVHWDDLLTATPLHNTEKMCADDAFMLMYTSGTTGKPKGTLHTHSGFPIKAAFDAGICMDVTKGDTVFWFTDMGWMMGPFLIYGGLINGATVVLYEGAPDFPQPDRLWQLVDRHDVTHLGISPTLIRALMKYDDKWTDGHSFSQLQVIASTGEPWTNEAWHWLFERIGKKKIPIFNYSGGTEISGGILGNVLVRPIGVSTFNTAIPGMAADVYNDAGKPIRNEVGELVITKPWVGMTNGFWKDDHRYIRSYWSRWEKTWVHGDWVIADDDGFWTITGRSDDLLTIAGRRIGPGEMENVLASYEDVHEAGVIGVPHDVKGEDAVCFVVLTNKEMNDEQMKEKLRSYVAHKMGRALRPQTIHIISDLPKTRNGKVMRRLMKAAYLGEQLGDTSALENPDVLKEIAALGKSGKDK